jgi:hypothetical protein
LGEENELIEIIYVVLMIFLLVAAPWPNSPLASYPFAGHIIYFLLFLCLGLAIWGFGTGGPRLGRIGGLVGILTG